MTIPAYDSYRDSGLPSPDKIPSHWEVASIKRLGSIRYGIGEPPPYRDEGVPLIRATNVDHGKISLAGLVKVDPADIPGNRAVWLEDGDIIVVRSGAYTGDSALIRKEHLPAIAGFDMVLRPSDCEPAFLEFSLLSSYLKDGQIDLERMRAAQPHLNAEELGACKVTLPSRAEQVAITAFLDRETAKIDALVEEQRRLVEVLKEKRQAVISHAVTKGLDPTVPMKDSGVEWLGEVPAHWEVRRISTLFREISEPGDDELPMLSVSIHDGVSDDEVDPDGVERKVTRSEDRTKYKRVEPNDLVYNMMRAWQGGFGTVRVTGMVSPAYVVARPLAPTPTQYVEHLLRTPKAVEEMRRRSRGVTDFRLRLYWDEFKDMRIVAPPESEQRAILASVNAIVERGEALATQAEAAITLLQERRSALISAAVTGKIDVRGLVSTPSQTEAA